MSSVSQTPAIKGRLVLSKPVRNVLTVVAAVVAVVAIAVGPGAPGIAAVALQAHFHGPNFALLAALPLAIKIHLGAALLALVIGGTLMLVRKGQRFHRTAGWAWVGLVALVAGSSLFITTLRPGHFSILHLLTGWTLIILPVAVMWAKRHQVARHRRTMMGLFYGGFAANLFIAFIPGRVLWQTFFG
jgi:uncharacterized membrane protein